jgi:hypothetical protein
VKLAHSYSAIKQFEDCPQRYYRQRILKDVVDKGGVASIYGDRIHKHIEARLRDKTPLPEEAAKFEPICHSLEQSAGNDSEFYIEKELVLNDKLEPTGWWDADVWLRSKLDILVVRGDKAIVIDWKTGKRRPDPFQMELFAVQVFRHFPQVNTVTTILVWLKDMAKDVEIYSREKDANRIWASILGKIRRIHDAADADVWPAKPSGLCDYCPAKTSCAWARIMR